jgi:hypothetical protein
MEMLETTLRQQEMGDQGSVEPSGRGAGCYNPSEKKFVRQKNPSVT